MICEKCGAEIENNAAFCSNCGAKVNSKRKCSKCGAELDEDALFCAECGTRVDSGKLNNTDNTDNDVSATKIPSDKNIGAGQSDVNDKEPEMSDLLNIVEKNTSYFEKVFTSIRDGKKGKFNWAALFFSFHYCFYRKSPEIAKKYFKKVMIVYIVGMLLSAGACLVISNIATLKYSIIFALVSLILLLVQVIRCGINFNREYYNHCIRYAKENKKSSQFTGTSIQKCIAVMLIWTAIVVGLGVTVGVSYSHALFRIIDEEFIEGIDGFDDYGTYDSTLNDSEDNNYSDNSIDDNENTYVDNGDDDENLVTGESRRNTGDISDFAGHYIGDYDGSYATMNIYSSYDSGSAVGNVSLFVGNNTDYPSYSSYSLEGEMMKVNDDTYMVVSDDGTAAYLQMISAKYDMLLFNLTIDDTWIEQYTMDEQYDLP